MARHDELTASRPCVRALNPNPNPIPQAGPQSVTPQPSCKVWPNAETVGHLTPMRGLAEDASTRTPTQPLVPRPNPNSNPQPSLEWSRQSFQVWPGAQAVDDQPGGHHVEHGLAEHALVLAGPVPNGHAQPRCIEPRHDHGQVPAWWIGIGVRKKEHRGLNWRRGAARCWGWSRG